MEEAKLRATAEAKAAEEAMTAAARARAKAEEDARLKAETEAKLKAAEANEIARAAAEAKAAEEARTAAAIATARALEQANAKAAAEVKLKAAEEARETAEADAAQQAKLRAAAEANAAEEARIAAAAKVRAEAEAEARAVAESEAKRQAAEAAAAAAKAKALEEASAKAEADAKLRAAEEARATAEAKVAEEATLRAAAEAKAIQEAQLRAATEVKAAEEARIAAAAKAQAEEEARAKSEREAKLRAAAEANAAKEAKLRTEADAKAAKETKLRADAEAKSKAEEKEKRNTAKDSVWFYTSAGDRLGPVSFEQLRAMVADSSLNPRLDMVWRNTMDAWVPAGQIDGLFERNNVPVAPKEPLAAPAEPIRTQQLSPRTPLTKNGGCPSGRRRSLIIATLVFPFIWHFVLGAASPFLIKQFGEVLMGKILPLAAFVPLLVMVHLGLRRLRNLGMSRWWLLAVFAPILNLWLGHRCFACPAGYARHKKLDPPGMILACLYWLVVLSVVVFIATYIALLSGAIQSPTVLEKLRDLIKVASGAAAKL